MFERYTEAARRTLFFARFETTKVGGTAIEAEHLLLGLLRADKGLMPQLFASANMSYSNAREKIAQHLVTADHLPASAEVPFSPVTDRILRRAATAADGLRHTAIGPEHLLLALLIEGGSFAAAFLESHGISADIVRQRITVAGPLDNGQEREPSAQGSSSALESVERVRFLVEELVDSETRSSRTDSATGVIAEIYHHLDALKRYLTRH